MKLLLVCTSGGHFSTMSRLEDFWSRHERTWVTDQMDDTLSLNTSRERVRWLPYQAPRDWVSFLFNLPKVLYIFLQERPDLIVSTGASIAVGFAFFAKLTSTSFIYVESISRTNDISLTGKLVYYLSEKFYVQAPELSKRYPKAVFAGYVI